MHKDKFLVWCAVKRHLDKSSIYHTKIRYDLLFKWLGRKKLTADTAEEYILYLREKGLKNASINSHIRVINLIDIYERENGKDTNLLRKISYFPKESSTPTFLSVEEIEAIIRVKKDYSKYPYKGYGHDIDRTYRNAIWFMAGTGCRYDEMASTLVQNCFLGIGQGYVFFPKEITKTNEDRTVPLPPLLAEELKDFIKNKKPGDLIFTTSTGRKIAEQCFNPELRKRVELAGINKHVTSHDFRHSYVQTHRRSGTDILTLSKLVGHKDPKTTLGYDKFDLEDLIKGAENHPLFSRYVSTDKIITRIKEAIDKFPIKYDPRFDYKIEEQKDSIVFTVKVKSIDTK